MKLMETPPLALKLKVVLVFLKFSKRNLAWPWFTIIHTMLIYISMTQFDIVQPSKSKTALEMPKSEQVLEKVVI